MNVILQKIQTSVKSKIPKATWATLATISIVVLGFVALPSVWFWISWEIVGGVLVAVGCIGEWRLIGQERHPAEKKLIAAVAIGVTMELMGLAHSIPEAIRMERANLELQKEVAMLKAPRTLTFRQTLALQNSLNAIRPGRVFFSYVHDARAREYAFSLAVPFWQRNFDVHPNFFTSDTLIMGLTNGSDVNLKFDGVVIADDRKHPSYGRAIKRALEAAKIPVLDDKQNVLSESLSDSNTVGLWIYEMP